jgi:hypothetical protein
LEIVLTTFHFMASELIDDDVFNVMQALCKVCAFDPTATALDNFAKNYENCKFKRGRGVGRQDQQDNDLVDLNMLMLEGTPETIASRVCPLTEPQLDASQVQSVIFQDMVGKSFPPQSGKAYALRSYNVLYDCLINKHLDHQQQPAGVAMTHESLCSVPCSTQVLAEYEKAGARGRLFFSHAIMPLLDVRVIEDAFYNATITQSYPRIKAIKGIMMDQYPDLFKVAHWTDSFVSEWVREIDEKAGNTVPRPRSQGICIANTEQCLTTMEQNMFLSIRLNGARTDHDSVYFDICNDRTADHTVIVDWELEQARRVTFLAGVPLNEAVFYTDAEVFRRYKQHVALDPASGAVTVVDMDYPVSIVRQRDQAVINGNHISTQMTGVKRARISSDYVAPAMPPPPPPHHHVTGRSVQERRALPMPVTTATDNVPASSSTTGASNLLARMGINARKN